MKNAFCPILLLVVVTCHTKSIAGEAITGAKAGDLQSNLSVLNLFGEQPEAIQDLYSTAYQTLAANPNATFMDVADESEFQRICKANDIVHLGGPMLGAVTSQGANIWLRTVKPAEVEVRVNVDGTEKSYGPVKTTKQPDLTAVVPVTGLKPSSRYPYRVVVDGHPVTIPGHAAISTAPENSQSGKVRIAFGSCFHRWGLGNPTQSARIRSRNPAAMLLLGDIAVQDRNNHLGLHRADYFDNDKAGIPKGYTLADKAAVRDLFKQSWNNPACGFGDQRRGIFLRTRIGPCDVIMVDNRYFREGTAGSFLGQEQMDWLEQQLMDCQGPFIIMSCGTMWSDYVSTGKDSWGRWDPEGRERIFQLIEKNRIGGVLLISGDRHGARGFRIPRPSGFELYEFGAASLGGRRGPPVRKPEWNTQLYGIADKYAFGEFTIDATLPDPEVTFRLIQENGTELHKLTLTRSQLTPPVSHE